MEKLVERLGHLERRIADAETRFASLREENARLRAALAGEGPRSDRVPEETGLESRPVRLAILEAERREIRSRIRSLIDVL